MVRKLFSGKFLLITIATVAVVGLIGTGVFAYLFFFQSNGGDAAKNKPSAWQEKVAACRYNSRCWGLKNRFKADRACVNQALASENESIAKENGYGKLMNHWAWANKDKGTLHYWGQGLKRPDKSGDLHRYKFSCVYNPETKTALIEWVERQR